MILEISKTAWNLLLMCPRVVSSMLSSSHRNLHAPMLSLKRAVSEHLFETGADITQFLRQLYSRSIKASACHEVLAYTIKSLLSILCGLYPLNANYNLESGFNIHQPCLPSLLTRAFNGTSPNDNPVPKALLNPCVMQKK